jgi:DNA replication regulator DPB11
VLVNRKNWYQYCAGITLASAFSRRTTHLLCPSGTGAKYAHALQWGVPVVDMKWLAAMARTGIVPAVHAFLVSPAEAETDAAPEPQTQEAEDPLQPSIPARVASLAVPSQPRRGMSVSPPKIPDHRTKALEESIVSLLGKRSAMQEEESEVPLKRGRLYRSRVKPLIDTATRCLLTHPCVLQQTSDALPVLVLDGDERGSVFGKAQLLSPVSDEGSDPDEQSLRVLYEDPGQRAEQRRLANLIGESIEGVRDDVPKTPNR